MPKGLIAVHVTPNAYVQVDAGRFVAYPAVLTAMQLATSA